MPVLKIKTNLEQFVTYTFYNHINTYLTIQRRIQHNYWQYDRRHLQRILVQQCCSHHIVLCLLNAKFHSQFSRLSTTMYVCMYMSRNFDSCRYFRLRLWLLQLFALILVKDVFYGYTRKVESLFDFCMWKFWNCTAMSYV